MRLEIWFECVGELGPFRRLAALPVRIALKNPRPSSQDAQTNARDGQARAPLVHLLNLSLCGLSAERLLALALVAAPVGPSFGEIGGRKRCRDFGVLCLELGFRLRRRKVWFFLFFLFFLCLM